MTEIIEKILLATNHEVHFIDGKTAFYSNGCVAYFFFLNLELSEMANLKRYSDFEKNNKYKSLLDQFNNQVLEGIANTIEKNSALFILVKCDNITAIENYQQQILLLEEDEYFFKKYVIFYTEPAIKGLLSVDQIIPLLQEKVKDESNYDIFANNGYINKIAEYIVILQLFIKLPFLKLAFDVENYKLLDEKISNSLGNDLERVFDNVVKNSKKIIATDFESIENENAIDELLNLLTND